MILHPSVLALLLASALCVLLLAGAAPSMLAIVRHWNPASGDERQLALERRTYFLSLVAGFVLSTQIVSLLLFVFTADRMAAMIVGAMCAVGTLNVNGFGFPALIAQIVLFFAACAWLAINAADARSPEYPLVRVKYVLLLLLLPLALAAAALQFRFFASVRVDVITSCCGSLYSTENPGLAGSATGLPPLPAMVFFYAALAAAIVAAFIYRRRGRGAYLLAVASALAFAAAIIGMLSFLSLYIYEQPNHHCPFCILKPEYGLRGYLLYLPLFLSTAAGLSVGALRPFAAHPALNEIAPRLSRRLAAWSGGLFLLFAVLATGMIFTSRLVLIEG